MRPLLFAMLALVISGCAYYTTGPVDDASYSRERMDAINARSQCKALARNLVQIARCETR